MNTQLKVSTSKLKYYKFKTMAKNKVVLDIYWTFVELYFGIVD